MGEAVVKMREYIIQNGPQIVQKNYNANDLKIKLTSEDFFKTTYGQSLSDIFFLVPSLNNNTILLVFLI